MMNFPDVVRIEPAGVCNFKCTHCPVGVEGGKRRILPYQDFMIFFDLLPFVPRVLVLYHGGEPTMNKNLEGMIQFAKLQGVEKVVLNTNASNLKADFSDLDEMRVSFDGQSPEENDGIRVGSHFHKHAPAVLELLHSPRRPKKVVIYNAGTGEPAQYLLDYFRGEDVTFRGEPLRTWARVHNEPLPSNGVRYCQNLFETFTILSNGDVPMCCEDLQGDAIQGSVHVQPPLRIWERMEKVRQDFKEGNYPKLCQSCWVTTR